MDKVTKIDVAELDDIREQLNVLKKCVKNLKEADITEKELIRYSDIKDKLDSITGSVYKFRKKLLTEEMQKSLSVPIYRQYLQLLYEDIRLINTFCDSNQGRDYFLGLL